MAAQKEFLLFHHSDIAISKPMHIEMFAVESFG